MFKSITTNIMVESVKETMEFYEKNFGFISVVSVPKNEDEFNFAILVKDGLSLMFQLKESLIEEYPSLDTKVIQPMFTLFITVDNVKDLYDELKDKMKIAKELHQTFYGRDEFAVFDNNNNILTISSDEN